MRVTPDNEKMERLPLSQRLRRLSADGWTIGAILIAGFVALPVAAVIWLAFAPSDDIWDHLAATVLPYYAQTTVILMGGVGLGTFVIGTGTAWLVTMCRFPGRRVFEWAMLLPLAVPTYVLAYVYTDVLEYAGPVQEALRLMFGWQTSRDYWFPEIRSLGGAIVMMTLVLYPYVYLLSRAAFLEQSVCVLEVSRIVPGKAGVRVGHAVAPGGPDLCAGLRLHRRPGIRRARPGSAPLDVRVANQP